MSDKATWNPEGANRKIRKWASSLPVGSTEFECDGKWALTVRYGGEETRAIQERKGATIYVDGSPCKTQSDAIRAMTASLGISDPSVFGEVAYRGVEAAATYLERRGFTILDRCWACDAGSIDIVAEDDSDLVFVEVETKTDSREGMPENGVSSEKRKTLEAIAVEYLKAHDDADIAVRFDVISILLIGTDRAFLRHHINALSIASCSAA